MQPGENKVYAVYDLGGGTFDVSIINICRRHQGGRDGWRPRLGGLDMDEEMMKWALRQIKAKHNVDLAGDEAGAAPAEGGGGRREKASGADARPPSSTCRT